MWMKRMAGKRKLEAVRSLQLSASELLPQIDDEGRAAVEPARFLARVVVLRTFLAVADRVQPFRRHAAADEIVAHGVRAAIAESEVVFGRADAASMAFDLHAQ